LPVAEMATVYECGSAAWALGIASVAMAATRISNCQSSFEPGRSDFEFLLRRPLSID